ncbi:glycerate kinase [Bacillus sp. PS06]|uniref:glycerate kinase n=1 Tax=Bacillus sp. PS06 TaxID=2764176 RepID=UPI001782A64F|nr:glycerate kinase [Bacillus sp. PS06]MBD8069100.1 glycerate kinase [Bacillus sp. PS06]
MKVVVAPDSFKGSISAPELCAAVKKGILRIYPSASVIELPLADGGEGTMENLVLASGGSVIHKVVKDPLGRPVKAGFGVLGDEETVVIEIAQASGLPLVPLKERNPLLASSFGTGQLVKEALDMGYRKFLIGLGGSATNDAGTGLLKALGMRFFNENGEDLMEGGGALIELDHVDDILLDPRLKDCSFLIASDVTNPLCGPNGASAVFGPQKGATPEDVKTLDKSLTHYSQIVHSTKGINLIDITGGGAAGGIGASLVAFLGATIKPGIEVVMNAIQFEEKISNANLIITGEGKLDAQTLSGKVIAGVTQVAKPQQIPVVAICGQRNLDSKQMDELGLIAGFSIVPGPTTLEASLENASRWTTECTEQIMRLVKFS